MIDESFVRDAIAFAVDGAIPFGGDAPHNLTVLVRLLDGDYDPEIAVWDVEDVDPPSPDEIRGMVAAYQAHLEATTYQRQRATSYPHVGDQLDAILKGFNQLRLDGTALPADLDMLIGQWLAVKAKYPKPSASDDA